VDRKGGVELARLLPIYLMVIGICGGSLVLWSLIQYWRFHGRNRRSVNKNLETQALADFTNNSVEAVRSWQGARRVVAYHDANAHIVAVETDPGALYGKALQQAIASAEAAKANVVVADANAAVADANANDNDVAAPSANENALPINTETNEPDALIAASLEAPIAIAANSAPDAANTLVETTNATQSQETGISASAPTDAAPKAKRKRIRRVA
jgi:PgaD-like protein